MSLINWVVTPINTPVILHNCSKCGCQSEFECSGNFRINAQQHNLDIWLIYKCKKCNTTFNLDLFSRINPTDIDPTLYKKLLANDKQLAVKYSFDTSVMSKNKVSICSNHTEYQLDGENLPIDTNEAELHIHCSYLLGVRLDKLLSQKMGLSREQIKKLCKNGGIVCKQSADASKIKVKDDILLRIDLLQIRQTMNKKV